MTPLQRILFLQGQHCFFCDRTIPQGDASLDHLVPASRGGSDHPDNLVACCKSLNALFGNMSIKEKVCVILKQNGKFTCPNPPKPNGASQPPPSSQPPRAQPQPAPKTAATRPPNPLLPAKREVADFISHLPDGGAPETR